MIKRLNIFRAFGSVCYYFIILRKPEIDKKKYEFRTKQKRAMCRRDA